MAMLCTVAASKGKIAIMADSGATAHLISDHTLLHNFKPEPTQVKMADNTITTALGVGDLHLVVDTVHGDLSVVNLTQVLWLPTAPVPLLSVARLVDAGGKLQLAAQTTMVLPDGEPVTLIRAGAMWCLQAQPVPPPKQPPIAFAGAAATVDWQPPFPPTTRATTTTKQPPSLATLTDEDITRMHERGGHLHERAMKILGLIPKGARLPPCEFCAMGKSKKAKVARKAKRERAPKGTLVHMDILGACSPSLGGYRWALVFVEDYSRFISVHLLKSKTEVLVETQAYLDVMRINGVELGLGTTFQSDSDSLFKDVEFAAFCRQHGISQRFSPPGLMACNGRAERAIGTLQDTARTMLIAAGLDDSFWAVALQHAAFVRNVSPSAPLGGKTPYSIINGHNFDYSKLRVFGCKAVLHVESARRTKWQAKGRQAIYIGRATNSACDRFYIPSTRRVVESAQATFFEHRRMGQGEELDTPLPMSVFVPNTAGGGSGGSGISSGSGHTGGEAPSAAAPAQHPLAQQPDSDQDLESPPPSPEPPGYSPLSSAASPMSPSTCSSEHSSRAASPADLDDVVVVPHPHYPPPAAAAAVTWPEDSESYSETSSDAGSDDEGRTSADARAARQEASLERAMTVQAIPDEPTLSQALASPDREHWLTAMAAELHNLESTGTFRAMNRSDVPSGCKILRSKFVLRVKRDDRGEVVRHKARIVVLGCQQEPGDYGQTYAPVVTMQTLRVMFAVAVQNGLTLYGYDCTAAFLNSELKEDIYCYPPSGLSAALGPDYGGDGGDSQHTVWKLQRTLYGLKQAPKNWHDTLRSWRNSWWAMVFDERPATRVCLFWKVLSRGSLGCTFCSGRGRQAWGPAPGTVCGCARRSIPDHVTGRSQVHFGPADSSRRGQHLGPPRAVCASAAETVPDGHLQRNQHAAHGRVHGHGEAHARHPFGAATSQPTARACWKFAVPSQCQPARHYHGGAPAGAHRGSPYDRGLAGSNACPPLSARESTGGHGLSASQLPTVSDWLGGRVLGSPGHGVSLGVWLSDAGRHRPGQLAYSAPKVHGHIHHGKRIHCSV
eukprot:m.191253 g.191253  ORF g.191253 m.191253 type:complete len:1065 (-) comp21721_c0_seq12:767-3961(-)